MYSIIEHKHRFASWAAGRAANVKGCRFTVEQGKKLLKTQSYMKLPLPLTIYPIIVSLIQATAGGDGV